MSRFKITNFALITIAIMMSACSTTENKKPIDTNKAHDEYHNFVLNNKEAITIQSKSLYELSKPYKSYIKNEAEKEKLPSSIYALAAIESAYKEDAVSPNKNCIGMWQLNYFMGREMGLSINNNIDERKDWKKSTTAALKYIKTNAHKNFNDNYDLAILAYSVGTSNVKKSMEENNTDDVWVLIQDSKLFDNNSKIYFFKYMAYSNEFKTLEHNNID